MSRILLIDDELASRLVMHNRLKDLGHEVVVAENGATGLLEARETPFDLVLVDAGLSSGIGGLEVCRRLKQMPQTTSVPVVLIARQSGARDEAHKGFEAGCDAFVTKAELVVLDDILRALLRSKAVQDELTRQVRTFEEANRRLQEAQQRGGDLEGGLSEGGSARDLAAGRPDGLLLVDSEGIVRYADRGARDLFGAGLEGKNLGRLAPASGLEAFVRDARTEAREGFRFDLPARTGRGGRAVLAAVVPLIATPGSKDPELRVVLVIDNTKRWLSTELLRLHDYVLPRREVGVLLDAARAAYGPAAIVGTTEAAARLRARVAEAARGSHPVLILGAPGSGKEHAARALHFSSDSGGPFLPVGCAGLSAENLESELFGHVKGAFEGALQDRPGLLQQGAHGTLYLSDVEQLPLPLQDKLVRVLREGRVARAGSERTEVSDVRVVASSTGELGERVQEGAFGPELFAMLAPFTIRVPALRERREDVAALAQHFLVRCAAGLPGLEVSDEALWAMEHHDWPGNVRELEACVRRACQQAAGVEVIEVAHLPPALIELAAKLPRTELLPSQPSARVALSSEHAGAARNEVAELSSELAALRPGGAERPGQRAPWEIGPEDPPSLELYEMKALLHALERTGGDKLAAARLLKVGKSTLYRKLKRYGIA